MSQRQSDVQDLRSSIDRGLERLCELQGKTGEFESHAGPLDVDESTWVPDQLKFITALVVLAIDTIDDRRAAEMADKAVEFLLRERETGWQWRYWSQANPQFSFTPPDADDTACCSLAVATRGKKTRSNISVLKATRDPQGRFYTWLVPRRLGTRPSALWAMRDELRSLVRKHRTELWQTTEAERDDVDSVVNLNVIRYLGDRRCTRRSRDWVVSLLRDGREVGSDKWHRNPFTFYALAADAHRRGISGFDTVAAIVIEAIEAKVRSPEAALAPLELALATLALDGFGYTGPLIAELTRQIHSLQRPDGSWERSVFYYGGPKEVFGWSSEALSTATALQALTLASDKLGKR